MKGIKLSKTSWLILSAGVFVVILAGLGVTRSQQYRDQNRMNDELSMSETRLNSIDVTDLRRQVENLQSQVEEGNTQLDEAKQRLRQTVISVDVTDELYKIAAYSGVTVMRMTTAPISPNNLEGIGLSMTSLTATATGDLDKLVDFVINLNNGFATGYLSSAQISVPSPEGTPGDELEESEEPGEPPDEGDEEETEALEGTLPTVSIQMVVYSYEGE
jgi:hypothetical protein